MRRVNPRRLGLSAKRGTALLILALLGACSTVSVDFEPGTNPEVYFQRAQAASDQNDYERAQLIYRKLLETGITDLSYVIAAKYEIAFLDYKMGRLAMAVAGFNRLLEEYYPDGEPVLGAPQWPLVLSRKLLERLQPRGQSGRN